MAEAALKAYLGAGGGVVAYVGEWGGDTATPGFERALLDSCDLCTSIPLPGWGEARATLGLWRRKECRVVAFLRAGAPFYPFACGVCQDRVAGKSLWRCRLTGVLRCSEVCAVAGAISRRDEAALRLAVAIPLPETEAPAEIEGASTTVLAGPQTAAVKAVSGRESLPLKWGSPSCWISQSAGF